MKMRGLGAVACFAAVSCFNVSPAFAQNVTALSDAIKQRFGVAGYTDGQLGQDWCFNVETEPGYTYWYYALGKSGTPLKGTKIQHTARIQAIYKDSGMPKYASVFLGLDIPDKPFDLYVLPTKRAVVTSTGLQEPMKPPSSCMTFAQFLNAYALPFDLEADDVSKANLDEDSQNYLNPRYWIFNGRPHHVVGIASYGIALKYKDADGNSQSQKAALVVGFGGGAGP